MKYVWMFEHAMGHYEPQTTTTQATRFWGGQSNSEEY